MFDFYKADFYKVTAITFIYLTTKLLKTFMRGLAYCLEKS